MEREWELRQDRRTDWPHPDTRETQTNGHKRLTNPNAQEKVAYPTQEKRHLMWD